jgi:hypothetical protein
VLHVARSVRLPDFEELCGGVSRSDAQYGGDRSSFGCDRSDTLNAGEGDRLWRGLAPVSDETPPFDAWAMRQASGPHPLPARTSCRNAARMAELYRNATKKIDARTSIPRMVLNCRHRLPACPRQCSRRLGRGAAETGGVYVNGANLGVVAPAKAGVQ